MGNIMRNIIIEVGKRSCLLVDGKTGGYIHAYAKFATAKRKAKEIANGGKITIQYIDM